MNPLKVHGRDICSWKVKAVSGLLIRTGQGKGKPLAYGSGWERSTRGQCNRAMAMRRWGSDGIRWGKKNRRQEVFRESLAVPSPDLQPRSQAAEWNQTFPIMPAGAASSAPGSNSLYAKTKTLSSEVQDSKLGWSLMYSCQSQWHYGNNGDGPQRTKFWLSKLYPTLRTTHLPGPEPFSPLISSCSWEHLIPSGHSCLIALCKMLWTPSWRLALLDLLHLRDGNSSVGPQFLGHQGLMKLSSTKVETRAATKMP